MTEKDYSKWQTLRAKGKLRYILIYGILAWGFPTGIVFSLLQQDRQIWKICLNTVVFMMVAGIIWGLLTWRIAEKRANEFENKIK